MLKYALQTLGFPVGVRIEKDDGLYLLLNHIKINIQYHVVDEGYRVVGVSVDVRRCVRAADNKSVIKCFKYSFIGG
jgi:hypothetical protein